MSRTKKKALTQTELKGNEPSVAIHDEGQTVQVQPVPLRRQALSEPVRHMVATQQRGDDDHQLDGHERERDCPPPMEHFALKPPVFPFAALQVRAGVAGGGDGRFDKGRVVAATVQLSKETKIKQVRVKNWRGSSENEKKKLTVF